MIDDQYRLCIFSQVGATRETAAFSGISLAFRGSTDFGAPNGLSRGKKKIIGAPHLGHLEHPKSSKNFRRAMRIPNMCLFLKLDNGKAIYIADEQTDEQTHPVPYYNIGLL